MSRLDAPSETYVHERFIEVGTFGRVPGYAEGFYTSEGFWAIVFVGMLGRTIFEEEGGGWEAED